MRPSLWALLGLTVACARQRPVLDSDDWGTILFPPTKTDFSGLGEERHSISFGDHVYDFVQEPSPSQANLRAVLMVRTFSSGEHRHLAYAFGDEGTILTREAPSGAWKHVASPTGERLRGVTPFEARSVVGDHGTWLTQHTEGRWISEVTGVTEDLYAVTCSRRDYFAVGDRGTLVHRHEDGRFTRIETRTGANLRGVWPLERGTLSPRHLNLVGDDGTIVDCSLRTDPPICIPRPSPTRENLLQVTEVKGGLKSLHEVNGRFLMGLILGAEGTLLGVTAERVAPVDYRPILPTLPMGMERVLPKGFGEGALVAVGAGGLVVFDRLRLEPVVFGEPVALHDVTSALGDLFAVGDRGTIIYGAARPVPKEH